jgi:CheY-like chemotaxis protein
MMKQKLNCILLIDDDEAANFINEMVIHEAGCAEKVVTVQSGIDAIEYLKSRENNAYPRPDLMFVDINMPAMNGWEFLEMYGTPDKQHQARVVIVMLTTSLNPDDAEKAKKIAEVDDFKNKPLTVDALKEILNHYFPARG